MATMAALDNVLSFEKWIFRESMPARESGISTVVDRKYL
jgi:hypothetical protein